jgi:hypothetical protein
MTTQLAIEHLSGPRRNPPGTQLPASLAELTDPLWDRPAIPHTVITWSDVEATLPVGAGDPAAAIAGAPVFRVLPDRAHRLARGRPPTLDAVLFSVIVAALAGLAGAVVLHSGAQSNAWVSYETVAATAAMGASVELNGVRIVESTPSQLTKDGDETAAN